MFRPVLIAALLAATPVFGQTDPGPRGGPAGAGGALAGVDAGFFDASKDAFEEVDGVVNGLGPRFNLDSCAGCHAQPATGGTSPRVNPQVAVATLDGAKNKVPSFITPNGPVREARFVSDGGVHDLFVITGRADAQGCNIAQPDFAAAIAARNISFRIPTPVFGLGLVEATPDANFEAAARAQAKFPGITGRFNRSGNDGTITRFGWKAQNKSLMIFAGEAYNVEQGVTNEVFPQERDETPGCQFNALPEDHTNLTSVKSTPADAASDVTKFAAFMRMLAPPTPATKTPQVVAASAIPVHLPAAAGLIVFKTVGCDGCHIERQVTGKMSLIGKSKVEYRPFSDFALHDMGQGLADGIPQGLATGSEFRTAPLWGVGQRLFFLHDGRTSDLLAAITAHASPGSEANVVVRAFSLLPPAAKQELVNFLRSL